MNETRFFDLIAERTGLEIRAKDREVVARALAERARAFGAKNVADYLRLLERDTSESAAQWRALAPVLTNGESYFWRDKGQFELLKTTILPQLLRARGGAIRIWSAGCSSGEEVYSLAMLLDELQAADRSLRTNRATIVGTDINEEVLARARRGVYGNWSFRGVADELRARHFEPVGDAWQVRPHLRARVSFRALNLRAPEIANAAATEMASGERMRDFDLIVCRNVLIYLTPAAVDGAIQTFAAALSFGGYLLTGHAELTNRQLSGLVPQSFPASVIYQKTNARRDAAPPVKAPPPKAVPPKAPPPKAVTPKTPPPEAPSPQVPPPKAVTPEAVTPEAVTPIDISSRAAKAPSPVKPAPAKVAADAPAKVAADAPAKVAADAPAKVAADAPAKVAADAPAKVAADAPAKVAADAPASAAQLADADWFERAQKLADAGAHEAALALCRGAIERDGCCARAHLLWAHIEIERGETLRAKTLLKKVLYLAPDDARGYLELAALYDAENDERRAATMRAAAAKLDSGA